MTSAIPYGRGLPENAIASGHSTPLIMFFDSEVCVLRSRSL